jgi:metacaspase-1
MKKALLVGINYIGSGHELRGCINDANNMYATLAVAGFDVEMITEKDATTAGMIAALERLVADTVPGDVIVFHYSGHGSQLPSATEADGFEEIICPYDLDWVTKIITDKTLRDIFNRVSGGVNTTVILDCCHSGTMLNQDNSLMVTLNDVVTPGVVTPKGTKRFLEPPARIVKLLMGRRLVNWSATRDVNKDAMLIAACRAEQSSADALINGMMQGAATAALLYAIKANPVRTYKQLVTDMNDYMVVNGFAQRPELDGSPTLYDNLFLEAPKIVVPVAAPVVAPPIIVPVPPTMVNTIVPEPPRPVVPTVTPHKEHKGIVIGAIILVILAIFIFTH